MLFPKFMTYGQSADMFTALLPVNEQVNKDIQKLERDWT